MKELRLEKLKKSFEASLVFREAPIEDPLKVCFDYMGTDLTHKEVYTAANQVLRMHAGSCVTEMEGHVTDGCHVTDACHVTEVEFIARNVILGVTWSENRWVLNVNKKLAHYILITEGVLIKGVHYDVKPYQEVRSAEYKQYCENTQHNDTAQMSHLLNIS